jgi:hypothetical protein
MYWLTRRAFVASLAFFFMTGPVVAQSPIAISAVSVPAQVSAAKTVLLSNAGLDAASMVAFSLWGKTDTPYVQFVAATKSWGHYQLATTLVDSDLVFEFRIESALRNATPITTYSSFLNLSILDAKTHFVLWTIKTPLEVTRKFDQDVNVSVMHLIDKLKSVVAAAAISNTEK